MPDRSSGQDLPEERGRGSHARGSQPQYGAADAYRTEPVNSHRGRNGDGYGPGTPEAYRPVNGNPFGATIRSDYGSGQADPLGARTAGTYGTGQADPFGEADTTAAYGTRTAEANTGAGTAQSRPEAEPRTVSIRHAALDDVADSKGFLGALFDFGFQSFVTPKVIKVLYVLIMIGTVVSAMVFTIIAFKASLTFGVVTLLFGDPLFILIVLAIYRIILEFFVVIFRISEDIRALRERGGIG
jgi:hypothetical protein